MIEDLQPYPEMRGSGLPWLGTMPVHWDVRRNGRLFGVRREFGFPELPVLEVSISHGVRIRDSLADARKQEMSDRSKYQRAMRGDIAYNMMRMWQGAVGVAPVEGLISPAYVVATPFRDTDPTYYAYLFRTAAYMRQSEIFSRGIVPDRNRLYWESFKQIPSPYPPMAEQKLIARFLNWHGRKTSELIRLKTNLISKIIEYKKVAVGTAIRRGLNASALMKDSEIAWVGETPAHWSISRLKQIASLKSGESITALKIEQSGAIPVYGGNGLRGYTEDYTHDGSFVLIGRQGALCGNVHFVSGRFYASEHAVVVQPRRELNLTWLGELLRTMDLNQYSVAAAQPGLSVERIQELEVIVPPIREQMAIADHSRTIDTVAEAAISVFRREVVLLAELQSRLIAEVVTGKIDIRSRAHAIGDDYDGLQCIGSTTLREEGLIGDESAPEVAA